MVMIKRKCVKKVVAPAARTKTIVEDDVEDETTADMGADAEEAEEAEEPSTEEQRAKQEEEEAKARRKELKAMDVKDLKELIDSLGLERANKVEMVEAVLGHEAKLKLEKQKKEEAVRDVIVEKTRELESLPAQELKDRCFSAVILGSLTKQERVKKLMLQWQTQGGIEKALAQQNRDKRQTELETMDATALHKLACKANIDCLVKEVMVDRLLRKEVELGKFDPPKPRDIEQKVAVEPKATDLVATLLANEAALAKKKAEEEKQKEREALMEKMRETLKAMTVQDLKQQLQKKGVSTVGGKDQLVEALFARKIEEEALATKKNDLKALSKDSLKELVLSKGLKIGGVSEMIESIIKYEDMRKEEVRQHEVKVMEELKKKKAELEAKSGNDLKEMCVSRGLTSTLTIEGRVQTLLHDCQERGEIDKAIALSAQAARRAVLDAMDKGALKQLCNDLKVDPLVKPVLIERLLQFEADAGHFEAEDGKVPSEPPTKKQRVSKK